ATFPGNNGKIVFDCCAARADLLTMRPDGSGRTRLFRTAAYDSGAQWSPDGRRLVFTRLHRGAKTSSIVVVRSDGTHARVIHREQAGGAGGWSPSGKRIVFSNSIGGSSDIF